MDLATKHSVTLRNGVEMPLVGLGTSHDGGFSHEAIVHAFKIGYRLVELLRGIAANNCSLLQFRSQN